MRRIISAVLTVVWVTAGAQQDFSDVEIRPIMLADGLYMLEGRGGNIGVSVGPDGILLVDDQFAGLTDKIEATLRRLGDGALRFVVNTHHHGDHTGGNAAFAAKGATIVAQDHVRKRLLDEGRPVPALPVVTFDSSASVHFNGHEIKLIHHGPAHTDGDCVVYFSGANVIHMGDLFFNARFPFIDLDHGGSVDGYVASVERILATAPEGVRIIPGHGALADLDDLRDFHAMLEETVALVRDAREAGRSLEEIRAAGLPGKYRDWGTGFIDENRWIGILHRDAERQPKETRTP